MLGIPPDAAQAMKLSDMDEFLSSSACRGYYKRAEIDGKLWQAQLARLDSIIKSVSENSKGQASGFRGLARSMSRRR